MKNKIYDDKGYWNIEKGKHRPNPFVIRLAVDKMSLVSSSSSRKLQIEDCVGESIHVHWRQVRFEMSYEDFKMFSEKIEETLEELKKWE